jgi:hypothetical protein
MKQFKYKQFLIIASPISHQFDLWEEVEYQKIGDGTKEEPTGEKAVRRESHGYDMTFDRCIEKIVAMEATKGEETQELISLIFSFKEILEDIKQEFSKVKAD